MKLRELADILNPYDSVFVFECDDHEGKELYDGEVRLIPDDVLDHTVSFTDVPYQGTLEVCVLEKED